MCSETEEPDYADKLVDGIKKIEISNSICEGTTKKGNRCKKKVKGDNKYCYLHIPK